MVGCYRKDDRDGEVVDDRTEAAGKGGIGGAAGGRLRLK
jgi:hypothetical protein